ncbi:hypothetical protein ACGFYU_18995 [Streptomyces sp. NPDC048337]|uniref:hypothetical protein n=1 Tax=Streptomyces sp. NPDC048337 TaxID=3365535 RepID=UPI0037100961
MTERVGQQDPGRIPPMPAQPPQLGPVPQASSSGHPPRWAWWVIGIVVPVLGTAATMLATSAREGASPPPAAGVTAPAGTAGAAAASTPAASASPSKSATPSVGPLAPAPGTPSASPSAPAGPDLTAPAGYRAQQGRWGIAPPPCGETLLVDLDAGVSTSVKVKYAGEGATAEQTAPAELEYRPDGFGCGNPGEAPTYVKLMSTTGRQVGVLRAGQPQTYEGCRAAAGTGFGPVQLGGSAARERGIVKGAALCSVTDGGSVAMALIEDYSSEYTPAVSGRLIVWSKG